MPTSKSRVTVNLPNDLAKLVKERAGGSGRSVSNYLLRLIEADVGSAVQEEQAPYGSATSLPDARRALLEEELRKRDALKKTIPLPPKWKRSAPE